MRWSIPAWRAWQWIAWIWFLSHTAISVICLPRRVWTWVLPLAFGGLWLLAFAFNGWAACFLALLLAAAGALLIRGRRAWRLLRVRSLLAVWAIAVVTMGALYATERNELAKTTLAERFLMDGGGRAASVELSRLTDAAVLREILQKGRVWEDNDSRWTGGILFVRGPKVVHLGQGQVMANATKRLLAIADPGQELPLVVRAYERVRKACASSGVDGGMSIGVAVDRFFEADGDYFDLPDDSTTATLRRLWTAERTRIDNEVTTRPIP